MGTKIGRDLDGDWIGNNGYVDLRFHCGCYLGNCLTTLEL